MNTRNFRRAYFGTVEVVATGYTQLPNQQGLEATLFNGSSDVMLVKYTNGSELAMPAGVSKDFVLSSNLNELFVKAVTGPYEMTWEIRQ